MAVALICYLEHTGHAINLLLLFWNHWLVSFPIKTPQRYHQASLSSNHLDRLDSGSPLWCRRPRTSGSGWFYHSASEQARRTCWGIRKPDKGLAFSLTLWFAICFLLMLIVSDSSGMWAPALLYSDTIKISYKPLKQTLFNCATSQLHTCM